MSYSLKSEVPNLLFIYLDIFFKLGKITKINFTWMWQPKDQPLHVYWASQHGLLQETEVVEESVVSETRSKKTCFNFKIPPLAMSIFSRI